VRRRGSIRLIRAGSAKK